MQQDKKVSAGRIYCVVPEKIGAVRIVPLEKETTRAWLQDVRARQATESKRARPVRRAR